MGMPVDLGEGASSPIGSVRCGAVPSPYFLAPINTGFATNGAVNQRVLRFYSQRSGRGIGVCYVGNVAVADRYRTNAGTLSMSCKDGNLYRLAHVIAGNGSVPGLQLACDVSAIPAVREWVNPDVPTYVKRAQDELGAVPRQELESIAHAFVEGARTSVEAGFGAVQIHAAHGYLLSGLMSRTLNKRADNFGGDRLLLLKTIVTEMRRLFPRLIIDVRISMLEGLDAREAEVEDKSRLIRELVSLPLDIISISNGMYNVDKRYIYPPREFGHHPFLDMVLPFARDFPRVTWNVVGNIWDLRLLPPEIPRNVTVSIGRALIADPMLIERSRASQFADIRFCTACCGCHYYMGGRSTLSCSVNGEV